MEPFEPAALPELLRVYYRRLFPFSQYYRWLSYGRVEKRYFQHREFSFTLKDDVYIRYQSFSTQAELEKEMQKLSPYKIDVGAVYSHRPSQHNTVKPGAFQAQEKELVFDIDMTDYDDVRLCCSSAEICPKCWTLMTMAIHILDRALKEDFGFQHRLWVYSGRRGVHCWVCDASARKLSPAVRSGIVEYLSLVKGGREMVKKVHVGEKVHPFVRRSVSLVEDYFEDYAVDGQDFLASKERWDKVIALVPEALRETLQSDLPKLPGSRQRWHHLKKVLEQHQKATRPVSRSDWEVMLQLCFPRLDANVSKSLGHLLKSPFSVHPKTGRISVPIDLQAVDQFDPWAVPTISSLCHELDAIEGEEEVAAGDELEVSARRRARDYKKTSLGPYVQVFERFLDGLDQAHRGELLQRSDAQRDF
ncbi:DNA primase small subunit [Ornithorhynchus anatinus]|uniref:DNA primase small subunit n=1 Tax=Ornithorhynchus anatinus TaxID=9258 RepID=UPI0010A8632A|nr:DNA primase small subunit [Ornithorhynchus anatinus]